MYRDASIFYKLEAELVLELFLVVLWVAAFAGMASYVSEMSVFISILEGSESAFGPDPVVTNSKHSQSACVAIVIFGSVEL